MENPPKKFFRLAPGTEVRLKYAYIIRCDSVVKDENGEITEIHCTYFPETKSGLPSDKKVKGTLHWVSVPHAYEIEVRLYDRLFTESEPEDVAEGADFKDFLNPDSLKIVTGYTEPVAIGIRAGKAFQFERLGYFVVDPDSNDDKMVYNRVVTLKDSWAKIEQKGN
jgi:glutaminyl-tRNA synthetase